MAKCRLGCSTNERQSANLWRIVAGDVCKTIKPARRCETIGAWIVPTVILEAPDPDVPKRAGGQRVRQMPEGHSRHVRMHALSCRERRHQRRDRWIDPELVI